MCDPATLTTLALAAGGAGVSGYAENRALKRQDELAAQGLARNAELMRRAQGRVTDEIASVAKSNPDAERAKATTDYVDALKRAGLQHGGASLAAAPGNFSSRFAEDVGQARQGATVAGKDLAGTLAGIDAPQLQRTREATSRANTAINIDELAREAQANDYLTKLRASTVAPNPLLMAVGAGLTGFSKSYTPKGKVAVPGAPVPYDPNIPGPSPKYGGIFG